MATTRKGLECHIEQALLLPKNSSSGDLYQDIGLFFRQFKLTIKRKFNGYERNAKVCAKDFIV
jgi:hypothetical protein